MLAKTFMNLAYLRVARLEMTNYHHTEQSL